MSIADGNAGTVSYWTDHQSGVLHKIGSGLNPGYEYIDSTVQNLAGAVSFHVSMLPPPKPIPPELGSGWDAWFDYYHEMERANYKMTLKKLAEMMGFAYSTVKTKHGEYRRAKSQKQDTE